MKMMMFVVLSLALPAQAVEENPISKVLQLLSGLEAKINKEGEAAAKTQEEYAAWCEDRNANVGFEIETGKREKEGLQATIVKEASIISSSGSKIGQLAADIASDEADLKSTTEIRTAEQATFGAEEKELNEVINTLTRAIAVLSREMQNGGASMMQLKNAGSITQALTIMVDAAMVSSADASRLTALVQNSAESEDTDAGAPDASVYTSHTGDIVGVLQNLQDKAVEQLADARKKEMTAAHSFAMAKQSLEDSIKYATKDMGGAKQGKSAASQAKSQAEGELAVTSKDLDADIAQLADLKHDCASRAADFAAEKASREEELNALAAAKKVISESTSGAEKLSYGLEQVSFMQMSFLQRAFPHFETVTFIRKLAKKQHVPALDQLASQIVSAFRFGAKTHSDPFEKVKTLITDMIAQLEGQAGAEESHKAYCDEELQKSGEKKAEKSALVSKTSTSIDQMSARSAQLKEQVAALSKEVAQMTSAQAEMDKLRHAENAEYVTSKADMEQGISGVEAATKILREYYANADGAAAEGAGQGIIGMLEVCMSDFSKGLAEMVSTEEAAQASYDRATRENKLEGTTKDQDIKYQAAESVRLDKSVAEATSDRDAAADQLDAVNEYLAKLKEQCVAKATPYAERKARREAEVAGLRQALEILEGQQAALIQQHSARHVQRHLA